MPSVLPTEAPIQKGVGERPSEDSSGAKAEIQNQLREQLYGSSINKIRKEVEAEGAKEEDGRKE